MTTLVRFLIVALLLVLGMTAQAQVIFTETFDFSNDGGLVYCALLKTWSPY